MLHLSYNRKVVMRLEYQVFLKSPLVTLLAGSAPVEASLTLSSSDVARPKIGGRAKIFGGPKCLILGE